MITIVLAFLHVTGFLSRHDVLTVLLRVWETNPQPRHQVSIALLADVIRPDRPVVLNASLQCVSNKQNGPHPENAHLKKKYITAQRGATLTMRWGTSSAWSFKWFSLSLQVWVSFCLSASLPSLRGISAHSLYSGSETLRGRNRKTDQKPFQPTSEILVIQKCQWEQLVTQILPLLWVSHGYACALT